MEYCDYCHKELKKEEINYLEITDDNYDVILIPCCKKCYDEKIEEV